MKYFIIILHYICFKAIEHFKKKEQKSVHVHYNIPECQLHALKRKREKNNEVDFQWAKGGLQIVTG